MTERDNYLRTVRFQRPERLPCNFVLNAACWHHYPQDALQELLATHPRLFPGYQRRNGPVVPAYGPTSRAGQPYTDDWGCVWETTDDGIVGTVVRHPLADLDNLRTFRPPDPARCCGVGPVDWQQVEAGFRRAEAEGRIKMGSLPHGHTFLRLCDLCGYQTVILAMADEDPRLLELIGLVEAFNQELVRRNLDAGAEVMGYPEDLGMQNGPMLSPEFLRKFLKPSYQRLMAPARQAGLIVHMHSDGDIRTLVDDLVDGGVQIVNLQDLVNGIDWIRDKLAGRACIDLDVDRQQVTCFGTPEQIDVLIREEVEKLSTPDGGLMFTFGLYPGTPLANVKALMDAMEKYCAR